MLSHVGGSWAAAGKRAAHEKMVWGAVNRIDPPPVPQEETGGGQGMAKSCSPKRISTIMRITNLSASASNGMTSLGTDVARPAEWVSLSSEVEASMLIRGLDSKDCPLTHCPPGMTDHICAMAPA